MQVNTFRRYKSESFIQWFHKHHRTIFKVTMRSAVYLTILMATYHIITGGWSIYTFLVTYTFPIFQELM
jgi:hypothetical protein